MFIIILQLLNTNVEPLALRSVDLEAVYFSERYLTKISVKVDGNWKPVQLTLIHLVQNRSPYLRLLWQIVTYNILLSLGDSVTIYQTMIMERSHLIIEPDSKSHQIDGTLYIDLNPLFRVNQAPDPWFQTLSDYTTCDFTKNANKVKCYTSCNSSTVQYIVTVGEFYLSWDDADQVCRDLGGHLPSVTGEEDRQLLETLILGGDFTSDQTDSIYHTPCRHWGPLCGVYLGLQHPWVSTS